MRISINNFKSIGSLSNFELRPLTILSGTNSSGKSSFIQLLLLLKQTMEKDSSEQVLDMKGNLYKVRDYLDILKGKDKRNKLKVGFLLNKSDLTEYKGFDEFNLYDAFDEDKQIIVSSFIINIETNVKSNYIKFENRITSFSIETNVAVFSEKLYGGNYTIKNINYSSFVPSDYEIEFEDGTISREVPKLDGIKTVLKDFFKNLNYIGPVCQPPKDEYSFYEKNISVGIEGEYVAEVLFDLSDKIINYFKIEELENAVSFIKSEDRFLNAVKYWLCERFKLCSDIYSRKEAESYSIYVKSLSGIESTIKHVGFGISQVLPILVEGLRIKANETLVLEQPEIHLHPKAQSNLTDFLISLIQQGKKVIIETHSDHLITRLRRRIAEDPSSKLNDKVLLAFVEVGRNDVLFKNITIDDFGVVELPFPEDFIEKSDTELKAILKAQMKKRLNQKGE
jgi:predicted ATPase